VRNQAWALVAALDESVIASLECNTMPPAADRAEAFKAASAKHKVAQEAAQALAAEVRGPDVNVSRLKERAAL
jgi:hypothetical protein